MMPRQSRRPFIRTDSSGLTGGGAGWKRGAAVALRGGCFQVLVCALRTSEAHSSPPPRECLPRAARRLLRGGGEGGCWGRGGRPDAGVRGAAAASQRRHLLVLVQRVGVSAMHRYGGGRAAAERPAQLAALRALRAQVWRWPRRGRCWAVRRRHGRVLRGAAIRAAAERATGASAAAFLGGRMAYAAQLWRRAVRVRRRGAARAKAAPADGRRRLCCCGYRRRRWRPRPLCAQAAARWRCGHAVRRRRALDNRVQEVQGLQGRRRDVQPWRALGAQSPPLSVREPGRIRAAPTLKAPTAAAAAAAPSARGPGRCRSGCRVWTLCWTGLT